MRANATTPTAVAPPSRKAITPSATMNAHSAVQLAPNASWARRRLGFRAVAENARAESASRLRIGPNRFDCTPAAEPSQALAVAPRSRILAYGTPQQP